jgi:hypothetical protein
VYLVSLGIPAIEPGIRTDSSRKFVFVFGAKEHIEGETFSGQVSAWKPAVRQPGRPCEQFLAVAPVTYQAPVKITAVDEADGGGGHARIESVGASTAPAFAPMSSSSSCPA